MFKLSTKSLSRLEGVHPDLVRVVKHCITITPIDFTVIYGLRSLEEQKSLYQAGASKTMDSNHLTGKAVDLGALLFGKLTWEWKYYEQLNESMQQAAQAEQVLITWGGTWKSIRDGDHWELSRKQIL